MSLGKRVRAPKSSGCRVGVPKLQVEHVDSFHGN